MDGLRQCWFPTDFSPSAKQAAAEALELVKSSGGRLLFLHVWEPPLAYAIRYGSEMGMRPPMPHIATGDLKWEWQAFLSDLPSLKDIDWELHTREGHVITSITKAAEQHEVDMIVMGTHGRTGLPHMLLGSVAEGVVRRTSCSVLTIRPEAFQFDLLQNDAKTSKKREVNPHSPASPSLWFPQGESTVVGQSSFSN